MARNHRALLLFVVCSSFLISAKGNFFLDSNSFSKDTMILWDGAHISGTAETGSLSLIPELPNDPRQSTGIAYYHQPIRMIDHDRNITVSFSTSFKFRSIPEIYNNSPTDAIGDGMTFAFAPRRDWQGGAAGRLGLFPSGATEEKLFAIEFDTYQNTPNGDPVYDHVGVNALRNATSQQVEDMGFLSLDFRTGADMWSWIDYNSSSKVLEVRFSNTSGRPDEARLNYTVDLFGYLNEEMWVGFTAGTGDKYSYYYIDWWDFKTFGLPAKKESTNVGVIVGAVVGVGVILALAGVGLFVWVRRKGREAEQYKADEDLRQMPGLPDHFSYKQLSVATRAFSEASKLGEGGFGSVYKGTLVSSGSLVAVKKVSADSKQGVREFLAEVSIISQLRHRNVVQLMGYCRDRGKLLLVYELMPNGSLDKALFHPVSPQHVINWEQRMKIISGLASALHYLHEGWRQQVIHRDVKSSNVMLDDEFNAKLGDFGLARLVDHSKNAQTTMVAGTYGYIAPEATITGKFTDKTDVYAFGAVALEIATGRKAFDGTAPEDDVQIVDMVWQRLSEGKLISVVDKKLEGNYDVRDLEVVLVMGLLCSHPDPKSRPSMRQVVQVLAGDAPVPPVPATKPAPMFSSDFLAITLKDLQESRSCTMETELTTGSSSTTYNSSILSKSNTSFTRMNESLKSIGSVDI